MESKGPNQNLEVRWRGKHYLACPVTHDIGFEFWRSSILFDPFYYYITPVITPCLTPNNPIHPSPFCSPTPQKKKMLKIEYLILFTISQLVNYILFNEDGLFNHSIIIITNPRPRVYIRNQSRSWAHQESTGASPARTQENPSWSIHRSQQSSTPPWPNWTRKPKEGAHTREREIDREEYPLSEKSGGLRSFTHSAWREREKVENGKQGVGRAFERITDEVRRFREGLLKISRRKRDI